MDHPNEERQTESRETEESSRRRDSAQLRDRGSREARGTLRVARGGANDPRDVDGVTPLRYAADILSPTG